MRDEWIGVFDADAEETEKMVQLCATAEEAAAHAAENEKDAEEMRSLILQAVEGLGAKAAEVFSHGEEFEAVTVKHRSSLAGVPAGELPQAFQGWYTEFLPLMFQYFYNRLKKSQQISAAAAGRTEGLAKSSLPFTSPSRSILLWGTALRCGRTAPDISARPMRRPCERPHTLMHTPRHDS